MLGLAASQQQANNPAASRYQSSSAKGDDEDEDKAEEAEEDARGCSTSLSTVTVTVPSAAVVDTPDLVDAEAEEESNDVNGRQRGQESRTIDSSPGAMVAEASAALTGT